MKYIYEFSRDNARTPMQWDDSANAGFTGENVIPWIKVNPKYKEINAAAQIQDKDSILNYYRQLIKIRKEYDIIVYGTYDLILRDDKEIYAFTRTEDNRRLLVICNFTCSEPIFNLPQNIIYSSANLIISNYECDEVSCINRIELRPYECRVYILEN